MKHVLVDTGCIVALLDRSERNHERCVSVVEDLSASLVTCEAVIAECCYLLGDISGAPDAVLENVARGIFAIPFRLADDADRVRELMSKYRKVPMDLADACLVALAEELGTGEILTLDKDFTIYRWRRNRPFKNLLPFVF